MPIYYGGRKVKSLHYGGRKIKQAWFGGKRVFDTRKRKVSMPVKFGFLRYTFNSKYATGDMNLLDETGDMVSFSAPVTANLDCSYDGGSNIPAGQKIDAGKKVYPLKTGQYTFTEV